MEEKKDIATGGIRSGAKLAPTSPRRCYQAGSMLAGYRAGAVGGATIHHDDLRIELRHRVEQTALAQLIPPPRARVLRRPLPGA